MGMFGAPPALRSTRPPSPLDPAEQNDFREHRVTPEAERETWRDELGEREKPEKPDRTVELLADEWAPISVPVGALGIVPIQLIGDDRTRRSAVILNTGTEALHLAPEPERFTLDPSDVGHAAFLLPAGASITVTTTRAVFVRATGGSDAGVSVFIERAVRTR